MTPNCKDIIKELILDEIIGVDLNRLILETSGAIVYIDECDGDILVTSAPIPKPVLNNVCQGG